MDTSLPVAVAALIVAAVAYAYSRRLARRLAMVEEQYWQLKFDHGELKAKVDPAPAVHNPTATFVPLINLRPEAGPAPGSRPSTSPPPGK